ncbi:MAG TPA: helix-hairpin-helix domain-containing protein [Chitinophagaceae bacterium]|nr:helix-hairpin-helix domain-containing protein [Chitinophagaceae bacterium]
MTWHEFVRDYLSFTRRERIGIITLVILILLVAFYPVFSPLNSNSEQVPIDTAWFSTMKKIKMNTPPDIQSSFQDNDRDENYSSYQYDMSKGSYGNTSKGELFNFDPNTLNEAGWQKLGLRDKTISTIQNFLKKGGRFKKSEDLKKIYGLRTNEYERLAPFIKIETFTTKPTDLVSEKKVTEYPASKNFNAKYSIIEINTADTTAFISLPGIGSKLANRIISFREKLGGFYSIEQVGETYALPDSTFQKIKQWLKLENTTLNKISINTATVDELKAHPYINYSLANPIIAYRNQHGPYSNVEDVKKVMVVTEEIYKKISPYLTTQ